MSNQIITKTLLNFKQLIKTLKKQKLINKQSLEKIKKVELTNPIKLETIKNLREHKKYKKIVELLKPHSFLEKGQDWLESKVNNEKQEVVLRQSAIWAQSITWTIIGGTVFGIIWLSLAKTEEIIVAPGRLEPITGVIDIQMPVGGIAEEILVKDGERINQGQVLVALDNEITLAKLKAFEDNLKINQEILRRLEPLTKEGAISEVQYLQQKNKVNDLKRSVIETQVTMKYQKITAPIDGIIFDLKPKGKGFVARSSEPIMKIVPFDDLLARVEIDSRNIGFIKVGKLADISIDSFPASDFGVIKGEVTKIGSDALLPDPALNKGYRFPAEIRLTNQYLKIKKGQKLPLQVGMSLRANIKLRKVSYLQLLLNTFSQKTDSLRTL